MRTAATERENTCELYHKPLFGRTDKRFCNDTCRNTFNRIKAKKEKVVVNENIPEIFRIIKENYEILKSAAPKELNDNESVVTETSKLMETGFNARFFTSIHTDKDGETWHCCFEMGFKSGEVYTFINDFPEQAVI